MKELFHVRTVPRHLHSLQLEADLTTCKNELKKKTLVTVFHRRRCWPEKRRYTIILSQYERGNIKKNNIGIE